MRGTGGGSSTSPSSYIPLFLVFLSGIGFSIQTLFIKLLSTDDGFSGSFQIIFLRGLTQAVLSLIFIYRDFRQQCERNGESKQALFGSTSTVRSLLALRSLFGYGGIAFAFLSVEKLPIGDATVLVMLSPLFASLCSWAVLREPFRLGEMVAAAIALAGVVLVARPPFIFGAENDAARSALSDEM
jgi:drug/metabolite transporter (DMT)-like permease